MQPTVPPPEEDASSEHLSCLAAAVDGRHLPWVEFSEACKEGGCDGHDQLRLKERVQDVC